MLLASGVVEAGIASLTSRRLTPHDIVVARNDDDAFALLWEYPGALHEQRLELIEAGLTAGNREVAADERELRRAMVGNKALECSQRAPKDSLGCLKVWLTIEYRLLVIDVLAHVTKVGIREMKNPGRWIHLSSGHHVAARDVLGALAYEGFDGSRVAHAEACVRGTPLGERASGSPHRPSAGKRHRRGHYRQPSRRVLFPEGALPGRQALR